MKLPICHRFRKTPDCGVLNDVVRLYSDIVFGTAILAVRWRSVVPGRHGANPSGSANAVGFPGYP
jgi:hypothetical protein